MQGDLVHRFIMAKFEFLTKKRFLLEFFPFGFVLGVSLDIRGNRRYGSTPVKETVNMRKAWVYNLQ